MARNDRHPHRIRSLIAVSCNSRYRVTTGRNGTVTETAIRVNADPRPDDSICPNQLPGLFPRPRTGRLDQNGFSLLALKSPG